MNRSRTVTVVRIVVAVAVAVALVWGVARNWTEISQDLQRVSLGALLLSFVPAAVGTWLTMLGWRVVLADLGSPLHVAPAAGVWFVGQLGKYLPGSVWTVLVQADMASHLHVPRRRTGVASLVTIGLSVLTGLLVGAPSIPLLLQRPGSSGLVWVLLGIPLLALLCWPPVLDRIVGWGLRVLRQQPLEKNLSGRAVLGAVLIFCVAWLCFGVHILVLANAVGAEPSATLTVASLTGFALSGALSMVTIILPGRAGRPRRAADPHPRVGDAGVGGDRRGHRVPVRRDPRRRAGGRRRLGVCAPPPPRRLTRGARARGGGRCPRSRSRRGLAAG